MKKFTTIAATTLLGTAAVAGTVVLANAATSGSADAAVRGAGIAHVAPQSHQYAAFFTPSGNINCYVYTESASCTVLKTSYKPYSRTPNSVSTEVTVFDKTERGLADRDSQRTSKTIMSTEIPTTWSVSPIWWWHAGYQSIDRTFYGNHGRYAVLSYGSSIRSGNFTCSSATSGVTCTNLKTHHGFIVSATRFRAY